MLAVRVPLLVTQSILLGVPLGKHNNIRREQISPLRNKL